MLVISTFIIKMLYSSKKMRSENINFQKLWNSSRINKVMRTLRTSQEVHFSNKNNSNMYLKVNFGVPETRTRRSRICHLRSTWRKYFFRPPFESAGFSYYILQISSRQVLFWRSAKLLKKVLKNRWFLCKNFQHFCLII